MHEEASSKYEKRGALGRYAQLHSKDWPFVIPWLEELRMKHLSGVNFSLLYLFGLRDGKDNRYTDHPVSPASCLDQ